MDLEEFKTDMEKPIHPTLESLFERAQLSLEEQAVYLRHKKYCEYWLLRSKLDYSQRPFSKIPNFIKLLARTLINLESDMVTGKKKHFIKTMFSENKDELHSFEISDEHLRSLKKTARIENTFFELDIMSFFLSNSFKIQLAESNKPGVKIPEFKATKNNISINIEAKRLNYDIILDNIHGDHMSKGIDYRISEEERSKGYIRKMLQLKSRFENALKKLQHIPSDEYYIIFIQATDLVC